MPLFIELVRSSAADRRQVEQIETDFSQAFASQRDRESYLAQIDRFAPLPVETYRVLASSPRLEALLLSYRTGHLRDPLLRAWGARGRGHSVISDSERYCRFFEGTDLKGLLRRNLITPSLHHVHHATNSAYIDTNKLKYLIMPSDWRPVGASSCAIEPAASLARE